MKTMNEKYIRKNIALSLELDNYIAAHMDILDRIPNGATIIITISGDQEFNSKSISMVKERKVEDPVVEAHKSGRGWSLRPFAAI